MYQYFAYNHDSQNGFVIQMQEDYGFVELLVNTIEDSSTNTTEKLPIDQSHSKWTTFNQSLRGELEISPKDKNFWSKCTYIIRVDSKTVSHGTISVLETGRQSNINQIAVLKLGHPTAVNMMQVNYTHYNICKIIKIIRHSLNKNINIWISKLMI